MLKPYQFPNKPHRIKIYSIFENTDGTNEKHYIHPDGKKNRLKAYARTQSTGKSNNDDGVQNASIYLFTINKREITNTMYIEFDKGYGIETYQIEGIDYLDFFKSEITLRATVITPREFESEVYA